MDEKHRLRAQGMVEFALILPGLLMMVLSIIEGALLFQSYLAIQHAAREAARYAVTYQPPITYSQAQAEDMLQGIPPGVPAYPTETEAQWYDRRVALIKQRALDQAMGIRILHPALTEAGFSALQSMPGFLGVRVQGFPAHDSDPVYDHPSLPGLPVRVEVHYRWQPLDPLIGAMWPSGVPLVGEAIMVNEGVQVGLGAVAPPQFPPPEALDPPTATYTPDGGGPTATPTTESTATATPTLTPTPTATPGYPYIVLEPSHAPWTEEELPGGEVVVYNHPDPGPYPVSWTDNCGTTTNLGFDLTTTGGTAAHAMPSEFDYLVECGGVPLEMDQTYTCTLSTSEASVLVPVYVPRRRPDLVVRQVILPEDMVGGGTFVIGIEIENTQDVAVSGTFDVDIYIDPNHTPVLAGQPGIGTTGGSSPKQWMADMPPSSTMILNYVVQLPPFGSHELWAQVDTSDTIDEANDDNNISGPIPLSVPCSAMCDDFDVTSLDGKWVLSNIGTSWGTGQARIEDTELFIYGTGSSIWNGSDGKFQLLHQGAVSGDFQMTVRVTDYPDAGGAKAGLMVRESTAVGERYVAVSVRYEGDGPYLQDFARLTDGATPQNSCSGPEYVPLPSSAFDAGGSGVWLRIAREGSTFTRSYSLDGETWHTRDCMQTTLSGFADPAVPGIMMASY